MATVTKYPSGNGTAIAGSWTNGTTGLNADDGTHAQFTTTTKNDVRTLQSGAVTFTDSDIPVGSTINRVDLEVQEQVTSGGTLRSLVRLGSTDGSNNDNTTDTTLTERTFSNVSRPGGGSWTESDLKGGTLTIRVEGRQPNNTTSRTYQWDYARITVDYSTPPKQTSVAEVSLAGGTEPVFRAMHRIRVRARVQSGSGTLRAALYEGGNNRSGDLESASLTTSLADYVLIIPDASAANITDYSNLGIRFWGYSAAGDTNTYEVDQIWLDVPNAAAAPPEPLARPVMVILETARRRASGW